MPLAVVTSFVKPTWMLKWYLLCRSVIPLQERTALWCQQTMGYYSRQSFQLYSLQLRCSSQRVNCAVGMYCELMMIFSQKEERHHWNNSACQHFSKFSRINYSIPSLRKGSGIFYPYSSHWHHNTYFWSALSCHSSAPFWSIKKMKRY